MAIKNITAITCTGARPESFKLLARMVALQTVRDRVFWVVVDDGPEPTNIKDLGVDRYLRANKIWRPGTNMQRYSMDQAFPHIRGNVLVFLEDDDYYPFDFCEVVESLLHIDDQGCLIGSANSLYYNIKSKRWRRMHNFAHASLAETGLKITPENLGLLYTAIHSGEKFFDIELWKMARAVGKCCRLVTEGLGSFGMKGVPGRFGIGVGHWHSLDQREWIADFDYQKLTEKVRDPVILQQYKRWGDGVFQV